MHAENISYCSTKNRELQKMTGLLPKSVIVPPFTGADSESFLVFTMEDRARKEYFTGIKISKIFTYALPITETSPCKFMFTHISLQRTENHTKWKQKLAYSPNW